MRENPSRPPPEWAARRKAPELSSAAAARGVFIAPVAGDDAGGVFYSVQRREFAAGYDGAESFHEKPPGTDKDNINKIFPG